MAGGAEVTGVAAFLEMESPAAAVDPQKLANVASEEGIDKNYNSDSKKIDLKDDVDFDSNGDSKSEREGKEVVDFMKKLKLNPQAKEFFPSSYYHGQMGITDFVPADKNMGNDDFPNAQRRRNNYSQNRRRLNDRTFRAQRDDSIRRTVYVSDIDHNVTEEQLAALFSSFGQSETEREMCARTVYCTNIDKKVSQADVKIFFESRCGEVSLLRLLGDHMHSTRIAFVEFSMAESAILALDCCGELLGSQRIRVSPSKTPVRPRMPRPDV